jgi:hypothetical protein
MVMVNLTFYAYLSGAQEFMMSWIILQACGEKKYGGMAPKKPLISKVGKNEFQKRKKNPSKIITQPKKIS